MMQRNKKAEIGLLFFPTMGFIVALILFLAFTSPDIKDVIGGKQMAVIKAVGEGEQLLSGVDASARMAAWKSVFDLGQQGGFFYDVGDDVERASEEYPCDKYVYNLWNSKSEKCWPDPKDAFEEYFSQNFERKFLSQIRRDASNIGYNYSVLEEEDKTIIRGLADDTLPINVSYSFKAISREEAVSKDFVKAMIMSEDEEITTCCKGICVVNIAKDYNDKFGVDSAKPFHYVWGGETPYDIEETKEKAKQSDSFFYGVSVTDVEPPRKGKPRTLTRPGFDCSGFVWWAYKHAGIPDFNHRLSAEEYENKETAQKICSSSSECRQTIEKGDAQPGDLVFLHSSSNSIATHIAVYVGNGMIIDSSSPRNGISLRKLPDYWLSKRYVTIKRFPYSSSCSLGEEELAENKLEQSLDAADEEKEKADKSASSTAGTSTDTQTDSGLEKEFSCDKFESGQKTACERILGYGEYIKKASDKHSVPEAFIMAFIMQETRGYSDAVSYADNSGRSGVGLGQFRYNTAMTEPFKSIFGSGLSPCGCVGGSKKVFGCSQGHNCPDNEPRFNPGKSVLAISAYLRKNLNRYEEYKDKDAFAMMAYFRGPGATDNSIKNAQIATGKKDPSWQEVVTFFVENSKSASPKVKEHITTYVDNMLLFMAKFGQGSFSTISSYKGSFSVSSEKISYHIGFYHVTPSFTTSIDYDLRVYEGIRVWAEQTYTTCSGIQKNMYKCVNEQKKVMNNLFNESKKYNLFKSVSAFNLPDFKDYFFFEFTNYTKCDGNNKGFYDFVEFFEDCYEFGNQNCYCEAPGAYIGDNKIIVSNNSLGFFTKADDELDYYDLSPGVVLDLRYQGTKIDGLRIQKDGSKYDVDYFNKNSNKYVDASTGKLFFIKKGEILNHITTTGTLQKCDLQGPKHKFRFCAMSGDEVPFFDAEYEKIVFNSVPIRFALDFYKPPPPCISPPCEDVLKSDDQVKEEQANPVSDDKKCVGLGNAKLKLTVNTKDLKPAYESFISKIATTVAPQLGALLFVKNFFVNKNKLPALVSVELDLKDASDDCDITGIVYKCGFGVKPYKDGKFDFSNPTGYIDIAKRFNSKSSLSLDAPEGCINFNNPDGSLTDGKIRYAKPVISDDVVSFTISKCEDPLTQFKNLEGLDIISAALNGFGYYFAFAYVNGANDYGPATVESVQIPSVMDQLEEQIGLKDILLLKSILMGNYENIFGLLGFSDQFQFIRSALAGASLDRMLSNLKGDALDSVYKEIGKNIKNKDAQEIVNDLAQDAVDGRISDDHAQNLINKLKDKLDDDEINNILQGLSKNTKTSDYLTDALNDLSYEKKAEILKKLPSELYSGLGTTGFVVSAATGFAASSGFNQREIDRLWQNALSNKDTLFKVLKELNPEDKLSMITDLVDKDPAAVLKTIVDNISDDKKASALKDLLNHVSDSDNDLARLIAYASPDDVKKAGIDYITNLPGLKEYVDIINIFTDFEGPSC